MSIAEEKAEQFITTFVTLSNYMYFSISALCYYDYCLNISREVELVWKAKLSLGTILYYTLRYPAMLFPVAEIMMRVFWPWQSDQRSELFAIVCSPNPDSLRHSCNKLPSSTQVQYGVRSHNVVQCSSVCSAARVRHAWP